MTEQIFRYCSSPAKGVAGSKGASDILQEKLTVVIRQVVQRHIGIKEPERLCLLPGDILIENTEQVSRTVAGQVNLLFKLRLYLAPVVTIGNKMAVLVAGECSQQYQCKEEGE